MHRAAIHLTVLALCGAGPLAGQESQEASLPNYVYEAYHRISYSDLDEWNRNYWEYSVPVLERLREEGVIQGWSHWQHQTGGEYNIRFTARTYDWASIETFWNEYLTGLREAMGEAEWNAGGGMVLEHRDEIWNIGAVHVPEGLEPTHIYASTFRLSFADMPEWNGMWSEVVAPILEEAMAEGILGGWVRLDHNTGGPHNSKVLYMFESWDDIDDLFGKLIGTLAEQHPDDWARANDIFQAHADAIWVPTPANGM